MGTNTTRPVRSREVTRERLLDGAMAVFVERGFGQSTPEQISKAAGYTRGAFYSNFGSTDDVFLALWRRQAALLVARVRDAAERVTSQSCRDRSFTDAVVSALDGMTVDLPWHVLMSEFEAHAARNDEVAAVVRAHRAELREALHPIIVRTLALFGRVIATDAETMGRAVVAAYEGATAQTMLEPENPALPRMGLELVARTIWAYSREQ